MDEGKIMRAGLIIAAAIIVLRIVAEQFGAPEMFDNILGVVWLYFLIPVCFALKITARGAASPYKVLFKDVLLFAVYTRVMVMVSYMLAYVFHWQAPRFSMRMGGNVGDNVGALNGLLIIPIRNALIWVVFATVVGMLIGAITILIRRRKPEGAASA